VFSFPAHLNQPLMKKPKVRYINNFGVYAKNFIFLALGVWPLVVRFLKQHYPDPDARIPAHILVRK
jgi:hypothetical protein